MTRGWGQDDGPDASGGGGRGVPLWRWPRRVGTRGLGALPRDALGALSIRADGRWQRRLAGAIDRVSLPPPFPVLIGQVSSLPSY